MVRLYSWKKNNQSGKNKSDQKNSPDENSEDFKLDPIVTPVEADPKFTPPDLKFDEPTPMSKQNKTTQISTHIDTEEKRPSTMSASNDDMKTDQELEKSSFNNIENQTSPKLQLYSFVKRDRSARVRWLLNEMALPYEQKWLDPYEAEHLSTDYLKLNPFGRVPVLTVNGTAVFESGAIMTYLLETHGTDALIPPVQSPERAAFWQWFYWGLTTLDVVIIDFLDAIASISENEQDSEEQVDVDPAVFDQLESVLNPLEQHLQTKDFLLKQFSAADIVVGHMLGLLSRRFAFDLFPNVDAYLKRLFNRPSSAEFVEGLTD